MSGLVMLTSPPK